MTTFAGCAASDRAGAPPLTVAIPAACERILTIVAEPDVKAGDDARLELAKTRGALNLANARIVRGRSCIAGVRSDFAAGKMK